MYRRVQNRLDFTVFYEIPGTNLRVALKFLRDASWIMASASLEPEVRNAFRVILDLFKPTIFWDIGANIGFYSWFVRLHPTIRRVVLIEPDPTNFALITRTIHKNALSDCQPFNIALSNVAGSASFLVDNASGATGSLESTSHRSNKHSLHHAYNMRETINCRTETIDGLISNGAAPPPEFIKIDVEGAEHLVLEGGWGCLLQYQPIMIIETSNVDLAQRICLQGYSAFRIDAGNLLFIPTANNDQLSVVSQAFQDYVCVA
jgi:FkbM family methyltransferase